MPSNRIGPGPVFAYEWITSSRRWQAYGVRSLFVSSLFVALLCAWAITASAMNLSAIRYVAVLGQVFFVAVIGTQLALVLLAAPAATAGAICLDRARGTLSHMLMTDLSAAEIVLGKLAGRLLPVLSLLVCALPMMVILTLLGGVEPAALFSAFAVVASVAVVGCSLAMFLSLWHKKTHEALLGTYAFLGAWLLVWPTLDLLAARTGWLWIMPSRKIDPFYMALAPYWHPGVVALGDYLWFTGVIGSISILLVTVTALKIRSVCTREQVKKRKRAPSSVQRANIWRILHHNVPWLTPSLDGNPIVWREWHRERPSAFKRAVTWIYIMVSTASSAVVVLFSEERELAAIVNGFQVATGLLLLGVWGATSLAEERARGSLDLLLCTPLSTWQIVTGKWLGAFRAAPLLALLPSFVIGSLAYIGEQNYVTAACLMMSYVLCAGAAVIGLGILMATWFSRLGRAVFVTVAVYAFVAVGWLIIAITLLNGGHDLAMASPFFWAGAVTIESGSRQDPTWLEPAILWIGIAVVWAVLLFDLARCDFDRRLGRVEDSRASLGWPSARARVVAAGYVLLSVLVAVCSLRRDWAIAAAVMFELGSILVAGMAASTSSIDLIRGGEGTLRSSRLSPERVIVIKWVGAFRYALLFIALSSLFIVIHAGPDFGLWRHFVTVLLYMLAVSAAATGVGVAMFARFPRSSQAVLFAVLISALAIVPWFSLVRPFAGTVLGNSLSAISPIQVIESLDRAVINSTPSGASATAWPSLGIVVYAVSAALLLLAARETLRRTKTTGEVAVTTRETRVPRLTTGN